MLRKLFNVLTIVALSIGLVSLSPSIAAKTTDGPTITKLPTVAAGTIVSKRPHLRSPREDVAVRGLEKAGVLKPGAKPEEVTAALENYYYEFSKRSEDGLSPEVEAFHLKREKELASPQATAQAIQPVSVNVFGLAVQFAVTETITAQGFDAVGDCVPVTQTITGPLQGQVAYPDAGDNNTIWYSPTQTADPSFYGNLVFGYDGIGRVRSDLTDPNDGLPGINLAGYTVQDYYDNVAGAGNVTINGTFDGWVSVNHSEGYYGAPDCPVDNDGGITHVGQIVIDALEAYSDTNPTYYTDTSPNAFWKQFDKNEDGVVDAMWIVHSGADEAAGGGAEGEFAIWSHSWSLSNQGLTAFKVYEGNPATTDDDIYVDPYTVQPEMADLGVLVEEFGHNFFGLPDLYTTDSNNSVGDWSEMSGGSWMGWIGGGTPVGMPLWFRMLAAYSGPGGVLTPLNWQEPMVTRSYTDPAADVEIGNLERTSTTDTREKGVRINLPDVQVNVPNRAGTGKAAWGQSVDGADRTLERQIPISSTATTLSMDVFWDLETGYDYAYILINGAPVTDTAHASAWAEGPLGWGLNGHGAATTFDFDVSSHQGETITLTVHMVCDIGTNWLGTWVDNVRLDSTTIDDFESAVAPNTFPGWTNDSWQVVPFSQSYANYYLVEWRTKTKYDQMVKTAYVTTDSDTNLWRVERVPYNIPGALVYYRNTAYGRSYSQRGTYGDAPSYGPKSKLLVVDMNYKPMRINPSYSNYLTGRASSFDSAMTMQASDAFTLTKILGVTTPAGPYQFASRPAVTEFNDGKGKYAGFWYPGSGPYVYYAGRDDSVVIPARTPYSTRITHFDLTPYPDLYESPSYDLATYGYWFGTGEPGDDVAQIGVNFKLLGKTGDNAYNSTATLRFGDLLPPYKSTFSPDVLFMPGTNTVTYQLVMNNTGTLPQTRHVGLVLDSELTFVSYSLVVGASGTSASTKGPTVIVPTLEWDIPIPADHTATLTVVAKIDLESDTPDMDLTSTWLHEDNMHNPVNDVSIPMVTEVNMNPIFLPLITK